MTSRIFNPTLLLLVAIGGAGMVGLYLLTGDEGVLRFFGICVLGLISAGIIWLLTYALLGILKGPDR